MTQDKDPIVESRSGPLFVNEGFDSSPQARYNDWEIPPLGIFLEEEI